MIDEGPAYDPFPFVQALRGLHYLCQHAGKSPCSRKAKYPGMCASDASFIRKVNPLIYSPLIFTILLTILVSVRSTHIYDFTSRAL